MTVMNSGKSFSVIAAIGIVFLLGVFPLFQVNTGSGSSALIPSSSAASCPSNEIMKAAFYGGAISTFNDLTLAGGQHEAPNFVQTEGIYPLAAPSGQLSWSTTLVKNITSNANYTQWTFNLKPGLKWSDGNPITSQDIVNNYSPKYAFNPANDYESVHNFTKSVVAINSTAAVFTLTKPDAQFPEAIGPEFFTSLYESSTLTSPDFNGFNMNLPSSGPFFAANYSASSTQVTYFRNPYFQPQPKICEVQTDLVESLSDVTPLLISGAADYGAIDPTAIPQLLATGHIKVEAEPGLMSQYMWYNPELYPFNITAFRQALVYSINESAIVQQALNGYGQTAYSSQGNVPPSTTEWYNPNQVTYSFNQTKALSLLHSAGFKTVGNVLEYPNGTSVSFSLWINDEYPVNLAAAQIIQTELLAIGININEQTASLGTIIGYTFHNSFGIDNGFIMDNSGGNVPGLPLADALPDGQVTYSFKSPPTWLWPSSAQAEYMSNLTAFETTGNPTLQHQYLDNIQVLNAEYLPILHLDWPDFTFAFNTQRWTNLPAAPTIEGTLINGTAWALISPASTSGTSASSSSISTNIGAATSSSSSSSSSSVSLPLSYLAIVVVVILVGASLAALGVRTKERFSTPPPR